MLFLVRARLSTLVLMACGFVPMTALADSAFHPAQTPAELALEKILRIADADNNQLSNLLHRPYGRDGRVDYAQILTPALIAAITKQENGLVQKECGGKYKKDELCGLDYSPITCAQDSLPAYVYHTVLDLGGRVVVEYAWPPDNKKAATYTLLQDKSGWKIDGISCADGDKFH